MASVCKSVGKFQEGEHDLVSSPLCWDSVEDIAAPSTC